MLCAFLVEYVTVSMYPLSLIIRSMPDIFEKDTVILSSVRWLWLDDVPTVWVSQPLFCAQLHIAGVGRLFPLWLNSTGRGGLSSFGLRAYGRTSPVPHTASVFRVEVILLFCKYRGADKSLARQGRKQARKYVKDARAFNSIETRSVIKSPPPCKARRRMKFTPFWPKH